MFICFTMETIERDILKVLTQFKFSIANENGFALRMHDYYHGYLKERMEEYFDGGWREKLIFSFCSVVWFEDRFLEKIEDDIFNNVNGHEFKAYLFAIVLLSDRKEEILDKLLENDNLFLPQKAWILASCRLLGLKVHLSSQNNYEPSCFEKYQQALTIVNSIRQKDGLQNLSFS